MNLVDPQFNLSRYAFLIAPDQLLGAVPMAICTVPEVTLKEAETWLVLTDRRFLLMVATAKHETVIKQFRLTDLSELQRYSGDIGVTGIKIITPLVSEKIEGYFLGKEIFLKQLLAKLQEFLATKTVDRVPLATPPRADWRFLLSEDVQKKLNRHLRTAMMASLLLWVCLISVKQLAFRYPTFAENSESQESESVLFQNSKIVVNDLVSQSESTSVSLNPVVSPRLPTPPQSMTVASPKKYFPQKRLSISKDSPWAL